MTVATLIFSVISLFELGIPASVGVAPAMLRADHSEQGLAGQGVGSLGQELNAGSGKVLSSRFAVHEAPSDSIPGMENAGDHNQPKCKTEVDLNVGGQPKWGRELRSFAVQKKTYEAVEACKDTGTDFQPKSPGILLVGLNADHMRNYAEHSKKWTFCSSLVSLATGRFFMGLGPDLSKTSCLAMGRSHCSNGNGAAVDKGGFLANPDLLTCIPGVVAQAVIKITVPSTRNRQRSSADTSHVVYGIHALGNRPEALRIVFYKASQYEAASGLSAVRSGQIKPLSFLTPTSNSLSVQLINMA